jgi:hypothetical protein
MQGRTVGAAIGHVLLLRAYWAHDGGVAALRE